MRATEVYPGLLVRGQVSVKLTPRRVRYDLEDLGVTAVYALNHRGIWQLEAEPDPSVKYVHRPLSDGKLVPERDARVLAQLVADDVRQGHRVLVMCDAGRNRTGLVVTLAIAELARVTPAEALARLRATRPTAVANAAFERYLVGSEVATEEVKS